MMSLVAKRFEDAKAGQPVVLLKSHRDGIADGDQCRDFIYVEDAGCGGALADGEAESIRYLQCRYRQGALV